MSFRATIRRWIPRSGSPAPLSLTDSKPRTWLRWLTAGTALGALSWFLPWIFHQTSVSEELYVLTYSRNAGSNVWADKITKDPAPWAEYIVDYPVKIAIQCKLKQWAISTNESATDGDDVAWLRISADRVDDEGFNCLARHVRPPFVYLRRGAEDALRESDGNFGEW